MDVIDWHEIQPFKLLLCSIKLIDRLEAIKTHWLFYFTLLSANAVVVTGYHYIFFQQSPFIFH